MKIVYLWRRFSQATKLLMRYFRGPRNYILDAKPKYMLQKNKDLPEKCFSDFLVFFRHIKKIKGISEKVIGFK